VVRFRGSFLCDHTVARRRAERLWQILHHHDYVHALGAMTGGQAVQMVRAGLEAIYVSGWQVAADGNLAEHVYPDQSLYPAHSVPAMVRRINNALLRADQWATASSSSPWPGFHALNSATFELASDYVVDGHERLRVAAGAGVRLGGRRLHGHPASARVGAGYFDEVAKVLSGGQTATLAMSGSTESAQFDG
jgi:isocitrate lyase